MAGAGSALLVLNSYSGWSANKSTVKAENLTHQQEEVDVLVIGGGMAGLFAAVKAQDAGARVVLVSKGRLGSSGMTPFAKGIFAYNPQKARISIDEFVEKISASAIGTNNPAYTRQVAEHSLERVNELKSWGFFDSPLYNKSFKNPIDERGIRVMERVMITHLIKENGRIAGAAGFSLDDGAIHFFNSKSVILCTGAGGFKPNGFPMRDLTHDGTVMAYQIGAKVTGKEWNDGHFAQATNPAACYDGWHGMFDRKPGITGVGIRHDLGVELNYLAYKKGNPLRMAPPGKEDLNIEGGPYRPPEFRQPGRPGERPPADENKQRRRPPDGKGPQKGDAPPGMAGTIVGGASAGMSIHKSEGLVPINDRCESTVPGLYAAGDALGSHMAGAIYTQIGSSLAGSAVQGAIAGETAAKYCKNIHIQKITSHKKDKIREEITAPLKRKSGYSPAWVTQTLQGIIIPNFVLYIKKEPILKAALAYVEELRDHHMPLLRASDLHELRLAHETVNMIISAEMKLRASIMRKESRCSHYRLDYPKMDNKNWRAWINIYKGKEGKMKLEKQPFGTWPSGKPI